MQSNSKGRAHLKHAARGDNWLSDMPPSWTAVMRHTGCLRQAREQARVEALHDDAIHDRGEIYARYWDWYGEDDNARNEEHYLFGKWMVARGYVWVRKRGWIKLDR
jgi:hypothetical protein